jgi:hypothetical protein
MSSGGSFGLRSPLGAMPSFYYAARSYARRHTSPPQAGWPDRDTRAVREIKDF